MHGDCPFKNRQNIAQPRLTGETDPHYLTPTPATLYANAKTAEYCKTIECLRNKGSHTIKKTLPLSPPYRPGPDQHRQDPA
jgi:hypothetical protein